VGAADLVGTQPLLDAGAQLAGVRAGAGAVDEAAEPRARLALDVLPPALHEESADICGQQNTSRASREKKRTLEKGKINTLYAPPTKPQVAPQVAALVARALEVQQAALHQPLDLEAHARVDEQVEVAARVLERERVRVDEVVGDEQVDLGRERRERRPRSPPGAEGHDRIPIVVAVLPVLPWDWVWCDWFLELCGGGGW